MNKILMIVMLIGIGTVAITPTPAFAKPGDLYLNKDGGCDKATRRVAARVKVVVASFMQPTAVDRCSPNAS